MDVSSPLTKLNRSLTLVYKLALTMAAGALVASVLAAFSHYKAVQGNLETAERLVGQGRLAEADALAHRLAFDPQTAWGQCFPGYFRTFALIRIRCLVRSGQVDSATAVAEAVRLHVDEMVHAAPFHVFIQTPLLWLQQIGVALISNLSTGFAPLERPGEWSGYEILFAELVAIRDAPTLEKLTADLASRFPRSPISVYANAARAELNPILFPTSAHAKPDPLPAPLPSAPASNVQESIPIPPPADTTATVETVSEPEPPAAALPPTWGIVTNSEARAFNPKNGQPIRQLHVGDVLVIEGSCTLQDSPALTGTLVLNNRNVSDLAFRASDLEIHDGLFNNVPLAEVALRSRLAEIVVQEAELAEQVAAGTAATTPEEKAYNLAQDKMAAFQKDVQALTAKLEKATGNERIAIIDKLRLMKYQEQAILREMQKKKEAMTVAGSSGRPRIEPQLMALRQEKKAVLKKLAEITR